MQTDIPRPQLVLGGEDGAQPLGVAELRVTQVKLDVFNGWDNALESLGQVSAVG